MIKRPLRLNFKKMEVMILIISILTSSLIEPKLQLQAEERKTGISSEINAEKIPPVLKWFAVENAEKRITVVIEEQGECFQPEEVVLEYSANEDEWRSVKTGEPWQTFGNEHTWIVDFEGEEEKEATYQFRISYKDYAGNEMVLPEQGAPVVEKCGEGSYQSCQEMFIDRCAPKLSGIQFSEPIQMYDCGEEQTNGGVTQRITGKETRLYYDGDVEVSFAVQESSFDGESVHWEVYYRQDQWDDWSLWEEEILYSYLQKAEAHEYCVKMPSGDGEYYFRISCMDKFQNQMIYSPDIVDTNIGEAYPEGISEGIYQSPIFIKDSVKPSVEIFLEGEPEEYYRGEYLKTKISVTEKNLNLDDTIVFVSVKDINEEVIKEACPNGFSYDPKSQKFRASWRKLSEWMIQGEESEKQTLLLEFSADGYYIVEVAAKDQAEQTVEEQTNFCMDRSAPYITVVTKEGESFTNEVNISSGILDEEKSDVKYSVINRGWFANVINKLTFGYFAQEKMIVKVSVHDEISGVESLAVTCLQEGKEVFDYKVSEPKKSKEDRSVVQYEIELPVDFKGIVKVRGTDCAQNTGKDTGAVGMIMETKELHDKYAKIRVEVQTPYSKTPGYYAGDVTVKFEAADGYSGFYEVNYLAGTYQETVTYPEGEEICLETSKTHIINADANNCNHVKMGIDFQDNAGHVEKLSKENSPAIHIDRTEPQIKVVYDQLDVNNEKYYKTERRAEVIIKERNFDPEDTRLVITGPDVKRNDWKHVSGEGCAGSSNPADTRHTDQCQWSLTIQFSEDGEYTFTCSTTDLAGNEASYGQTDVFVIDKKLPKMKVVFDNYEASNEWYYPAPRTATIEITERNFNASDVKINLTVIDDGKEIAKPTIGAWSKEGDVHRTTIVCDYDGEYHLDIQYTDLAGNRTENSFSERFVIDLTEPEIVITGIKDQSANNGIVAPVIFCTDTNYDKEKGMIEIIGYRNGSVEWKGQKIMFEKGVEFQLENFEVSPEQDDLYRMLVRACDLAGNSCETMIVFSVNRYGSVYTFDEATEKLVGETGSYYAAKEQDVVVYETNVDTLKFQKITLNFNGKLQNLVEGENFTVACEDNEYGWKQYAYWIGAENFTREGIYILNFYSEDFAQNKSDNQKKGKKIEFIVDKTAPSILLTGIEDKNQYRERKKEITIDVEDNVCVETVEVVVNGKKTTYDAFELAKMNGRIKYVLDCANDWQSLVVKSYDAAGNFTETQEIRFLITANLLVQFYRNQTLFYGSIGTVVFFGGCLGIFMKKRKKNTVSS